MATNTEHAAKMAVLTSMCANVNEAAKVLVENTATLKKLLQVCEEEHQQAKKKTNNGRDEARDLRVKHAETH